MSRKSSERGLIPRSTGGSVTPQKTGAARQRPRGASERGLIPRSTGGSVTPPKRAQALLSAILSIIFIIILLYVAFSGRILNEMRFVSLAVEEETAAFLAEACVEETIFFLRESANASDSALFGFFRKPAPIRVEPELTFVRNLVRKQFPGKNVILRAEIERLDMNPIPGDLVPDSLDRVGHVAISGEVKFGRGTSRIKVVKQFRLQDVSTPAPLKKYGLVSNKMGFIRNPDGKVAVWRLSSTEMNTMNNRWRYPMIIRGSGREMKGFPFSRQRLSYFFPTWADMKEHLEDNGRLIISGDVLSPDPLSLRIGAGGLAGVGRIFSADSTIVLNKTDISPNSLLGMGVLSGGAVILDGLRKAAPAPISIFLPSGKLCFRGESRIRGFVLAEDLENRAEAVKIEQDPVWATPRTVVILSGQNVVWRSSKTK